MKHNFSTSFKNDIVFGSPLKTKLITVFLPLLALIVITGHISAQNLEKQVDDYLKEQIQLNGIPGICTAIVRDGKVVYSRAFGVRELGKKETLTPENVFHFASVSKTFTATAIVQLIEKGKLKLDEPLVTYLPYFRLADERYKDITIRQIVNHTSGITRVEDLEWDKPQFDEGAAERYVRSLSNDTLRAAPGIHYFYTDKAVDMMADLISKVSGIPFEEYVKENIFKPLGMDHSSFIYPEIDNALRTTGHMGNPAKPSKVYPYNRAHTPSSTLNSNVVDMSHWLIANLNRGELNGHRILKADSYDLLWKPSTSLDIESEFNAFQLEHFMQFSPVTHGINWYLGEFHGHFVVFHAGVDTGFRSFEILLPNELIGVVIASNWYYTDTPKLAADIVDLILKLEGK